MAEDSSTSSRQTSLQEIIIALPSAAVAALVLALLVALAGCMWLALQAASENARDLAKSALVVLLPITVVVGTAVAMRHTATGAIDRLVAAFLEQAVLERLQRACALRNQQPYPFAAASLAQGTGGRSYASYVLQWAQGPMRGQHERVSVKMNVMNFEVIAAPVLRLADELSDVNLGLIVGPHNVDQVLAHPYARLASMAIQGSVEEGYQVSILLEACPEGVRMHLSFRQRLREHFLASPYLKRYYAEDAAILVGVLFDQLAASGRLASASAP